MYQRDVEEDLIDVGKEEEERASSASSGSPSHPAAWLQPPPGIFVGHSLATTALGDF